MAQRILPDWITSYLEYVENTEPPHLYKLWSAIAAVGGCLQRKCFLRWDEETYGNMYIILVGHSGIRKGTAMGPALKFLQAAGVPLGANAGSLQAIIKKLRKSTKQLMQTQVTTGTKPSITTGTTHSSMTILAPELIVFLGFDNKDLIGALCDWYDCKSPWVYDTVSRDEEPVYGMCLSLYGGTTPELIQSSLPREAVGGGFVSRTIFVYADKIGQLVPYPIASAKELQLKKNLEFDLEQILMLSGEFQISEGFLEAWGPWYLEQAAKPPFNHPMLNHYLARRPKHVLKLAMICSASRTSDKLIEVQDFTRAKAILAKTEPLMPRVFAGVGRNPDADVLDRIIRTIMLNKSITKARLLDLYLNDAPEENINKILSALKSMHKISESISGNDSLYVWIGGAA